MPFHRKLKTLKYFRLFFHLVTVFSLFIYWKNLSWADTPQSNPPPQGKPPIELIEGDDRIRCQLEEWAIWVEGENPKESSAKMKIIGDRDASGKKIANYAFHDVAHDQDRQFVSFKFYITSPFSRYDYDVWVRYGPREGDAGLEFIYQEGETFKEPKDPLPLNTLKMDRASEGSGGYLWEKIGAINTTRGWHEIIIKSGGGSVDIDAIVFTTRSTYIEEGKADREIQDRNAGVYFSGGVPLGGIGAGKIELCPDGKIRNLVSNNNWDEPINDIQGSFFAVHSHPIEGRGNPAFRVLTLNNPYGLPSVQKIKYHGVFPTVRMDFEDGQFPIHVSLDAFSPLIPNNIKDSALPVVLYEFTLTNPTNKEHGAAIAVSWENVVGMGGWGDPRGYFHWDDRNENRQRFITLAGSGLKGISFDTKQSLSPLSDGDYSLATGTLDGVDVTYNLQWDPQGGGQGDWRAFAEGGRFEDNRQEAKGNPGAAILSANTKLKPGESRKIRFALGWNMPNLISSQGREYGHAYSRWFVDSRSVVEYAFAHWDRLRLETYRLRTQLAKSNLPAWFQEQLLNGAFPIVANSWLTRDLYYSINESPGNMNGCMGTMDQRLVAGIFSSIFFSGLDASELDLFAQSQSKDLGSIPHDLGHSDLHGGLNRLGEDAWPDLQLSFILQSYRHYLWTNDKDFIENFYPKMKKALAYSMEKLDWDRDGIPNVRGGPMGCSYDSQATYGNVSYIGSLALAALQAMKNLSRRQDDSEYEERLDAWHKSARISFKKEFWNGRYFIHYREIMPHGDKSKEPRPLQVSESCHISQLAGQWFADLSGLGDLQDAGNIQSAVKAMGTLNGSPRWLCPPDEVDGVGQLTDPNTVSWTPYIEAFYCALALRHGDPENAWRVAKNIHQARIGETGNLYDFRLMHLLDGTAAWGRWYMTAPASWNILNALSGFTVDLPEGVMGLHPSLPKEFNGRLDVPLYAPSFWAWLNYSEKNNGAHQRNYNLRIIEGSPQETVNFKNMRLTIPATAKNVKVTLNDEKATFSREATERNNLILLSHFVIQKEKTLSIKLSYDTP